MDNHVNDNDICLFVTPDINHLLNAFLCVKHLKYFYSFDPYTGPWEVKITIIPMLQMTNLRLRKIKYLK